MPTHSGDSRDSFLNHVTVLVQTFTWPQEAENLPTFGPSDFHPKEKITMGNHAERVKSWIQRQGQGALLLNWYDEPIRGISLTDGLCHRFYALHWSKKCRQRPTKAARCPSFGATYGRIVWFAATISETTITCPYLPTQNQVSFVMWQN